MAEALEMKMIFANFENAPKLIISMAADATVRDLKTQLQSVWPSGEVPVCDDLSRIRLICMGSGILQDSNKIGAYVQALDYPTPINVSIRPAGVEASKTLKTAVALPTSQQHASASSSETGCGCALS